MKISNHQSLTSFAIHQKQTGLIWKIVRVRPRWLDQSLGPIPWAIRCRPLPLRLWPHGPDRRRVEGGAQSSAVAEKFVQEIRTSSLLPPTLALTDADQDTLPLLDPPTGEADDSSPRYYDLPIPFWMVIPWNYERDNDDDEKDEKVEGGDTLVVEAGQTNSQRNNKN